MFRSCGRFSINTSQGFAARQWLTVMYSQGITPESYPPLAVKLDDLSMRAEMAKIRAGIKRTVENMPRHEDFIARNCRAPAVAA
jgi:tryptophan halogenase